MNTAKNRAQYVAAWQSHVRQLSSLYLELASTANYAQNSAEYEAMRAQLMDVIERAADAAFPDEKAA